VALAFELSYLLFLQWKQEKEEMTKLVLPLPPLASLLFPE
jgi:hypothetical protein